LTGKRGVHALRESSVIGLTVGLVVLAEILAVAAHAALYYTCGRARSSSRR